MPFKERWGIRARGTIQILAKLHHSTFLNFILGTLHREGSRARKIRQKGGDNLAENIQAIISSLNAGGANSVGAQSAATAGVPPGAFAELLANAVYASKSGEAFNTGIARFELTQPSFGNSADGAGWDWTAALREIADFLKWAKEESSGLSSIQPDLNGTSLEGIFRQPLEHLSVEGTREIPIADALRMLADLIAADGLEGSKQSAAQHGEAILAYNLITGRNFGDNAQRLSELSDALRFIADFLAENPGAHLEASEGRNGSQVELDRMLRLLAEALAGWDTGRAEAKENGLLTALSRILSVDPQGNPQLENAVRLILEARERNASAVYSETRSALSSLIELLRGSNADSRQIADAIRQALDTVAGDEQNLKSALKMVLNALTGGGNQADKILSHANLSATDGLQSTGAQDGLSIKTAQGIVTLSILKAVSLPDGKCEFLVRLSSAEGGELVAKVIVDGTSASENVEAKGNATLPPGSEGFKSFETTDGARPAAIFARPGASLNVEAASNNVIPAPVSDDAKADARVQVTTTQNVGQARNPLPILTQPAPIETPIRMMRQGSVIEQILQGKEFEFKDVLAGLSNRHRIGSTRLTGEQFEPILGNNLSFAVREAAVTSESLLTHPSRITATELYRTITEHATEMRRLSETARLVRINVNPPHLGPVHTRIEMNGATISLTIAVSGLSAKEMIESQLSDLKTALQSQGFDSPQVGVEVETNEGRSWSNGGDAPEGQNAQDGDNRWGKGDVRNNDDARPRERTGLYI